MTTTDPQLDLLADGVRANRLAPFGTGGETSRAAALAGYERTGTQKVAVLAAHAAHPDGLTDHEAARLTGIDHHTHAGTRRKALMDDGLIERTDLTRATPSGSQAVVWRITETGRDVAAHIARITASEAGE